MKTTHTDEQLQAAIDKAFPEGGKKDGFRLDNFPRQIDWENEAPNRLAIARAFLDNLPEPQPPVVDGKTPEDVMQSVYYSTPADEYPFRKAASAVIAAFGKPQIDFTTDELIAIEALCKSQDLTFTQVMRQALRHYQMAVQGKPSLPQLRPISEAGARPERCVRIYFWEKEKFVWIPWHEIEDGFSTHFADIKLPADACVVVNETSETVEPDPYAELKAAHAAGKVIQHRFPGHLPWNDTDKPEFLKSREYRVKPEPETFEAHGKIWTRHTPGDPMPCDGEREVAIIFGMAEGSFSDFGKRWDWSGGGFDGWRYADAPTPEALEPEPTTANANPVEDMALGGQMYWRDLARQLADVWWKCHNVGASLQHGDIDTNVSFSVCCELHGGKVFHADTPLNAWLKAEKWLMSPDRENFPTACLQPA